MKDQDLPKMEVLQKVHLKLRVGLKVHCSWAKATESSMCGLLIRPKRVRVILC